MYFSTTRVKVNSSVGIRKGYVLAGSRVWRIFLTWSNALQQIGDGQEGCLEHSYFPSNSFWDCLSLMSSFDCYFSTLLLLIYDAKFLPGRIIIARLIFTSSVKLLWDFRYTLKWGWKKIGLPRCREVKLSAFFFSATLSLTGTDFLNGGGASISG